MRIPIVGEPDMPGPMRTFEPISGTTFDRVREAGQQLGQGIEQIGFNLPMRIKAAIDEGTLLKAETQSTVALQAFSDSLQDGKNPQNNDPSTFLSRWNDAKAHFIETQNQSPAVQNLHGAARIRYQAMMDRFDKLSTQQVGHMATEKALANTVGDTNTAYEMRLMNNDPEGAKAAVQSAMNTGALNPEIGKQMIFQIPIKSEYNQATAMMNRDPYSGGGPIVLEKALGEQNADGSYKYYPHVIGQQRQELMFYASRSARIVQAQTSEKYATQMAQGMPVDPVKAMRDLQLGLLTRTQYAAVMRPERTFSAQAYANAVTQISQYDPKADPTHDGEAKLWQTLTETGPNLSPAASSHLNSLLRSKLNPTNPLNGEAAKAGFQMINEGLTKWVFGKYETTLPPQYAGGPEKTVLNPKAYQDAMQRKADTTTAFMHWLQDPKNANATPADASAFIYHFAADSIRTHSAAILGGKSSAPTSSDLDSLLKKYGAGN